MFPLPHPHKKSHAGSDQEKMKVRQSNLENCCSVNYIHSMKSEKRCHCTETSWPCEHSRGTSSSKRGSILSMKSGHCSPETICHNAWYNWVIVYNSGPNTDARFLLKWRASNSMRILQWPLIYKVVESVYFVPCEYCLISPQYMIWLDWRQRSSPGHGHCTSCTRIQLLFILCTPNCIVSYVTSWVLIND